MAESESTPAATAPQASASSPAGSPPPTTAPAAAASTPASPSAAEQPAADAPIAVDSNPIYHPQPLEDDDDNDSSLGDENALSTASISSSILQYRKLHGRTYHNFGGADKVEYWAPNDDAQNDQLDINHHLLNLALDNKLFFAPLSKPTRVLDVGTGTGMWAIDFADEFPDCEVTGIDLSPIQPTWVPPNCKFELDDASQPWTFPDNHFDYIHFRYMIGCFKDWPAVYREAYRCLKPGGWIEHLDCTADVLSDDGSLPKDTVFVEWKKVFKEAGEKMGQTFEVVDNDNYVGWLKEAGFKDVKNTIIKTPVGSWPADPKWKEVGQFNQYMLDGGIEGLGLYIITNVLGWKYEEMQVFIAKVRAGLKNKNWHSYCVWGAAWGQKPYDE
ncbi:hypothetical protein QC761_300560 [Podospora bellae-mahoneyi]|uniref:S-adenosyl-L-methionine-dependent methyltransferase n=1 Tax=Podospora bellae-mahoneyi TaxID=2093777 RepID=A0ABR0FM28_9PEZI|nr:hypothetical protein QC761_300560 [Podospora bellae-mahoneyi]